MDSTIEIRKVGFNWYTYRVRVNNTLSVGHGSRRYVVEAVNRAIEKGTR